MSKKMVQPTVATKSGSVLVKCNCKSEYQDKRYGPGVRVYNVKKGGGASCTVCGSICK